MTSSSFSHLFRREHGTRFPDDLLHDRGEAFKRVLGVCPGHDLRPAWTGHRACKPVRATARAQSAIAVSKPAWRLIVRRMSSRLMRCGSNSTVAEWLA